MTLDELRQERSRVIAEAKQHPVEVTDARGRRLFTLWLPKGGSVNRKLYIVLYLVFTLEGLAMGTVFAKWRITKADGEAWKTLYQTCKGKK